MPPFLTSWRLAGRVKAWLAILLLVAVNGCGSGKTATTQSNDLFLEAKAALEAGDKAKALDALNRSIAIQPALWSYHERAKLHAEMGDDKAALADCDAALGLDPEDLDAAWIKSELAKPPADRFQGKFKAPPSSNR